MTKNEFIELFKEELEIEDQIISLDTELKSIGEWDSMGHMIVIALVSEHFDTKVTGKELKELSTINSLIEKIGTENFS